MNETTRHEVSTSYPIETMRKHWFWYTILGLILMVLGVIGAGYSAAVSIIVMLWIGAFLVAAGVLQFIYAFFTKYWRGLIVNLILGVLGVAAGIFMIAYPMKASLIFTLVIAAFLFVSGCLRIIFAIQVRSEPIWWIILITGIIAVALAILIWAQWPFSGLWIIGFFVSIEIFLMGWAMLVMSIAARYQ